MHKFPVICPPFPQRHVRTLRGIPRTTAYPSAYKSTNGHATWKLHHTHTHRRINTLWHWFNTDAEKDNRCVLQRAHQLPGSRWSSPAQLLIPDLTRYTGPHKITAWGNMATGIFFLRLLRFSPPPSLHAVNAFPWDSDANRQTPEITFYGFCSDFPSVLTQAGQDIPYGIYGI